jgi:hypothetical protein
MDKDTERLLDFQNARMPDRYPISPVPDWKKLFLTMYFILPIYIPPVS